MRSETAKIFNGIDEITTGDLELVMVCRSVSRSASGQFAMN